LTGPPTSNDSAPRDGNQRKDSGLRNTVAVRRRDADESDRDGRAPHPKILRRRFNLNWSRCVAGASILRGGATTEDWRPSRSCSRCRVFVSFESFCGISRPRLMESTKVRGLAGARPSRCRGRGKSMASQQRRPTEFCLP
jgi:hypothetical protein